jgi:hypothetical protein
MSALTDKLKKQARALIPRFYREYKGASDWWHSVKVDGAYYDLNFLTHDPDGTGEFPSGMQSQVKVVAYKHTSKPYPKGTSLGYFKGKKVRRKFEEMDVEENPAAARSGYHYMPDGRLMADSEHRMNPPRLFSKGGYKIVTTYSNGEVVISDITYATKAQAEHMTNYAHIMDQGGMYASGIPMKKPYPYKVEVLPVTSVAKNPPLSSHGSSIKIKRTHGLSLAEMRALYKLVKQGNNMADKYARKKLEVPYSESKSNLLAVINHHIADLSGR